MTEHDTALAAFAWVVGHATSGRVEADRVHRLLAPDTDLVRFAEGDVLAQQHARAEELKVLVEGDVVYGDTVRGGSAETVHVDETPWLPLGWSGLNLRRHRVTARAASDGLLLSLPFPAFDRLARSAPDVWSALIEFALRAATPTLWNARGLAPPEPEDVPTAVEVLARGAMAEDELLTMFDQSAALGGLPTACHAWLAARTEQYVVETGTRVLEQGRTSDGIWLLFSGRVQMTFDLADAGTDVRSRRAVRRANRSGTLLTVAGARTGLPIPFDVTPTRVTRLARIPLEALTEFAEEHPSWAGALLGQQLWQLRNWLTWTRSRIGTDFGDDGIAGVEHLVQDSSPLLPVNSRLYGVPHLLRHRLTRDDGFRHLYTAQLEGSSAERAVANTALDLLRDLERGHRFAVGMQATYDAVVGATGRTPAELRRVSTRRFRDALRHVPYVIRGLEHLPDDPNFMVIYNHMAYAEDSILANGFLFNPDSHFISGVLLEPRYGDGIRVARTNAATEFWRADYYESLGHIPVVTPDSGQLEETPEEKAARKQKFFDDCDAVLARGLPFSIAPEGTITEEESVTEASPGPLRPGAFLMSDQLPSRPRILPVALANFDRPAHHAVFSCVIGAPFSMADRGVDTTDREALGAFLEDYRKEFRGQVEEAIALGERVLQPGADLTGVVTNLGTVDAVHEEFEPDVRALELAVRSGGTRGGRTVFYGSSTMRLWDGLAADLDLPNAVNLGFGGSTLEACRLYFERVVVPHRPERLVLYAGDNDIGRGSSPDRLVGLFESFAATVREHCPTTRCWFVSIKPSPGRRDFTETVRTVNGRVRELVDADPQWRFVDWQRFLVDGDGEANPVMFQPDEIHVNDAAYAVLARLLRTELHRD